MPWIGTRTQWNTVSPGPVISPFDPGVGTPNNALIPQWPEPQTPRVDGRMRWLTEGLNRPYCLRWYGFLLYDTRSFIPAGSPIENCEAFWLDFNFSDPQRFGGSSVPSPYGSEVSFLARFDGPVGVGLSAWRFDIELSAAGEAPFNWEYENDGWSYNSKFDWLLSSGSFDPPGHSSLSPGSFPFIWFYLFPMAYCYPTDTFLPPDEVPTVPGSTVALFSKDAPQSVAATVNVPLTWQVKNWGLDQWWDPLVDSTKVITPNGINWIKLSVGVVGSDVTGSLQLKVFKNNGGYAGIAVDDQDSADTELMTITGPWVPTVAGDFWQVMVVSSVARDIVNASATWFSVEGTS